MGKDGAEIHWMDNQWFAQIKTHPMAVSQRLSLLLALCYACTQEPNITISIEASSSWCKQMQRLKNKHQALLRECCGRISVRIKWYKGGQGYERNAYRIKKTFVHCHTNSGGVYVTWCKLCFQTWCVYSSGVSLLEVPGILLLQAVAVQWSNSVELGSVPCLSWFL